MSGAGHLRAAELRFRAKRLGEKDFVRRHHKWCASLSSPRQKVQLLLSVLPLDRRKRPGLTPYSAEPLQ